MRLRRGRLFAAVAAAALTALALPLSANAAVQARQADAFVDSIGVGVHLAYSDTPYVSEFALAQQRLEELGVRHVRDDLYPARGDQYGRLEALAAAGIGSTLILGSPANGSAGLEGLLAVAAGLDGVEALEGPNEYSTMGGDPNWIANLRSYQQELYVKAKADPQLAALPVVGPSIVHGDQDELGDVSASLDRGNIHSYPQGDPPDKLGSAIKQAELNSAQKPIWATETGYHDALAWTGENRPVPEDVAATYMPRLFFEYWRWGIERTYSYELLDEFPNAAGDDAESHFGLLRNDLSPKPAFAALRNTIAILADPGARFAPAALEYTLSEGGVPLAGAESPGLHKVLLQKRDGSFYLALWRTTSVWDADGGAPIAAPSAPVELTTDPPPGSVSVYRPNGGAGPVATSVAPGQPFSVDVGPAVTILRLAPSEPVAPEPPPRPEPSAQVPPPPPRSEPSAEAPSPPQPTPLCTVPRLRGRTVAGARAALVRRDCALGSVRGLRRPGSRVVRQWPRAARVLPQNSHVGVKIRTHG
jgi:hypothetical protein